MLKQNDIIELVEKYIEKYRNDEFAKKTLNFICNNINFWSRENLDGHITASIWVLNKNLDKALLTHHLGLDMWFQLGGHIEKEDNTIYQACERELIEESGLKTFTIMSSEIFDIDVHLIPESKKGVKAHYHYDIRLLYIADDTHNLTYDTNESNEVAWVSFQDINLKTKEWSVMRMLEKSKKLDYLQLLHIPEASISNCKIS